MKGKFEKLLKEMIWAEEALKKDLNSRAGDNDANNLLLVSKKRQLKIGTWRKENQTTDAKQLKREKEEKEETRFKNVRSSNSSLGTRLWVVYSGEWPISVWVFGFYPQKVQWNYAKKEMKFFKKSQQKKSIGVKGLEKNFFSDGYT